MTDWHSTLLEVTDRIRRRSRNSRAAYLGKIRRAIHRAEERGPRRLHLACSNLAHGLAACEARDKDSLEGGEAPNIAIVTAYNDMLSAHQPFETYPDALRRAVRQVGAVAQVAGGVPAMCDGVTQGEPGMELSLWSRDVIAQSTAIALSHDMFDGALLMGVCDKIVPGLLIGALSFGHLPMVFVPAGPMPSGLSNKEKARIRQLYAEGKIGKAELLEAESASYHSPGTCTFYGTANSNQMFMELLGLHLPGASFVNPGTPLREALTAAAARQVVAMGRGDDFTPLGEMIDERSIVNALVGLLATGGSTNHTLHMVAVARAAGVLINWQDFDELSRVVPMLTRVYPNGTADVNHFHAAGGLPYLIGQLLDAGLLHGDVGTVAGGGLAAYRQLPELEGEALMWRDAGTDSGDRNVLRPASDPFQPTGGLRLLSGNLGRAVIKVSAVKEKYHQIEAPAVVFDNQEALGRAFGAGKLDRDFVAVVRFQGPRANGMPELHKLMPPLGVLQDRGFQVALVTDGRLSGASGKVPAAIHVTPEAHGGGPLAKIRDGDPIVIDAVAGHLEARVDPTEWSRRTPETIELGANTEGMGRELFSTFRRAVSGAEQGATTFGLETPPTAADSPPADPARDTEPITSGAG